MWQQAARRPPAACDVEDVLRLEGIQLHQDSVRIDGGVVRVSLRKQPA